jgi:hypothetical protein
MFVLNFAESFWRLASSERAILDHLSGGWRSKIFFRMIEAKQDTEIEHTFFNIAMIYHCF